MRRLMLDMSAKQLAERVGVSASFVSRVENDQSEPGMESAPRFAKALGLDEGDFLNMIGLATRAQRKAAIRRVLEVVGEVPELALPVVGPDGEPTGEVRRVELPVREDAFVMVGTEAPWTGDLVASRTRQPSDGVGVLTMRDGRLRAGYFRKAGHRRRWVEFPDGTRLDDPRTAFVILRHG